MRPYHGGNARADAPHAGRARRDLEPMNKPLLVFDMDGVLVDVTESYRETIQRTVEHFSSRRITRPEIQDWKNRGGWNDDWALSHALIREAGVEVEYESVVDYFNSI